MGGIREGGCLCGSLRYVATGEPRRITACHCKFCQKRSAAAFSVHAWFDEDKVAITGETMSVYQQSSDETGNWLRVNFCSKCGSTLMLTGEKMNGIRLMTVGSMDDPDSIDISAHVWARSAPHWLPMPQNVPCFETSSGAGLLRTPGAKV